MKTMVQNDEKSLHLKFVKLGHDRRKLTNELLALLPEIYSKQIYRKYATTIIEYAGKFGGLSKNVVLKRLRLEKHLAGKPLLKEAIKTEGVHKVALIASIATAETEAIWVDKLKNMSKAAVQELSKEVREKQKIAESECFFNSTNDLCSYEKLNCKAVPLKLKIELDDELTGLFLKLKKKFGKNLSNMDVIKKVFETVLGEKAEKVKDARKGNIFYKNISTRYIPAKIKKHLLIKSNHQCSYPNCNKPAEIFHHTKRFATSKSHDSLTTLCKIHHEFAHNGFITNESATIKNWQLSLGERPNHVDQLYREYRQHA